MKRVAIIGAGAAGLFAAQQLSEQPDVQVVVFEKAKAPAAKLRASGGGRANIMNAHILPMHYNHSGFMSRFLKQVSFQTLYATFEAMGLRMRVDEEQRVYPATFFSATVVDLLLHALSNRVEIHCNYEVRALKSVGRQWQVNDFPMRFDRVLLMTGSPAGLSPAKQLQHMQWLSTLALKVIPFRPSLVGFTLKRYPKMLSGCRAKAAVSLLQKGQLVYEECGEIIFKDDGISGIVVLNLSAHYNRLASPHNCSLVINFLFDDPTLNVDLYRQRYSSLVGLLHPKLCALYEQTPFDLRALSFDIQRVYPMENAQVASGGIALSEVDDRFQLRRYHGLFVGGELLDIDGVCGGYNLFFAFASAYWITKNLFCED